jgi:RNA polymerase sigma-70 factor (ECF subfamily)
MAQAEHRRVEIFPRPQAAAESFSGAAAHPFRRRAPRSTSRARNDLGSPDRADVASVRAQIEASRGGDRRALEEVIRHYQDRVAGFIISIVGRESDYEDLCQTAFVKMAFALPKLRSPEIFEPWLFRIARNVCIDHLRRLRWRRIFVPFTREHEQVSVEQPEEGSRTRVFEAALLQLPAEQRELVGLLREHDWSYQQLAEITNSSVSAVGTRLFRARARLRKLLKEIEE